MKKAATDRMKTIAAGVSGRTLSAAPILALLAVTTFACSASDSVAPAARPTWHWPSPAGYVGMPAADARGVVVSHTSSALIALDDTGAIQWEVKIDGLRDVAPALTEDLVLAATQETVVALDRDTGAKRWRAVMPERPGPAAVGPDRANTPAVLAGYAVVTTWEAGMVGLDLDDGSRAWHVDLPGLVIAPAAVGAAVAVASWDDGAEGAGLVALDPRTGRVRWRRPLAGAGVSGPTVVAEAEAEAGAPATVVVVTGARVALGLDPASGAERWRADLPGAGSPEVPPLALNDGQVLVADRLGNMTLLGSDGSIAWEQEGVGAAVRGGPVGPGPSGRFALPVDDGRLFLAGPQRSTAVLDPEGRVSGVTMIGRGDHALLAIGRREAAVNALDVLTGW